MIFLEHAVYERLVAAWVASAPTNIAPSAWSGTITDDEVMIALGEQCDVWPVSIREACIRDAIESEITS